MAKCSKTNSSLFQFCILILQTCLGFRNSSFKFQFYLYGKESDAHTSQTAFCFLLGLRDGEPLLRLVKDPLSRLGRKQL